MSFGASRSLSQVFAFFTHTTYSPGTAPAVASTHALHGVFPPKKQLDQIINIGFDQGAFNTSVCRA
jgi:hypothetical protein